MADIKNINLNGTNNLISLDIKFFRYEYNEPISVPANSYILVEPTNSLPAGKTIIGILSASAGNENLGIEAFSIDGTFGVRNDTDSAQSCWGNVSIAYVD